MKIPYFDTGSLHVEGAYRYFSLAGREFEKCDAPSFAPLYATYAECLVAFDAALEPSRCNFFTQPLVDADARRDAAYRGLVRRVQAGLQHFIPSKAEAARHVEQILARHGDPVSLPYLHENGALLNLVRDLDEPATRARMSLINVTEWFEELKESNEKFIALFNARDKEQGGQAVDAARKTRLDLDGAYHACVTRLNALAEVEGEENYAAVIAAMNRLIEYQRETFLSRGKKGVERKGTGKGGQNIEDCN
jgi:hypothetical protein